MSSRSRPAAPAPKPKAFSAEQLTNLREVFDALDVDRSGAITAREVLTVLRKMEPAATIEAARAMIAQGDADADQAIGFDEFKALMEAKLNEAPGLHEMVRLLDLDADGALGRRDLRAALQRVGMLVSEDDVDEMMRAADLAGKGSVTVPDLAAVFAEAGVSTAGIRTASAVSRAARPAA